MKPSVDPEAGAVLDPIEEEVLRFVTEKLAKRAGGVRSAHSPIFSSGLVDSFGTVELLAFLNETYLVEIDPASIDPLRLDTVASIAKLVRERQGGA